jgi:SAM-dependent methyltransferase
MQQQDLKDVDSHFEFGKNWASYAALIEEPQIERAEVGLTKLIPAQEFRGRAFLDIGCGSGLHALAATRLGASDVVAVDIDPDSVATTKAVLSSRVAGTPWRAEQVSVFDLDPARFGTFDIVYSWGVLHHTGNMWEAIDKAAAMVAPDGLLVIALYRKTHTDAFWKWEKRLYAHATPAVQKFIQTLYIAAFRLAMIATRKSFRDHVANYQSVRGMDFQHDIHDWLGGYPYETASASEVDARLAGLGFKAERVFARPISVGLFGSGCDEFVYRMQR